jgi:transcription initiation factor IIE alpha subunit
MISAFELFADSGMRSVFETLIDKKTADLKRIREELSISSELAADILGRLEGEGLVESVRGPISDFDTYFPSAKGLATGRQLNAFSRKSI